MANLRLLACLTSDELSKLTENMRKRNEAIQIQARYADQGLGFAALPLLRMEEESFDKHREAVICGGLRNVFAQFSNIPKTSLIADNAALPVSEVNSEGFRKSGIHLSSADFTEFRRYIENQVRELEMNAGGLNNRDNQLTLAVSTDPRMQQVRLDSPLLLNVSNFILIEEPNTPSGIEPSAYNNNDFTLGKSLSSDHIEQQLCPQGRVIAVYFRSAAETRYEELQLMDLKAKIECLKKISVHEAINPDKFDRQKFEQLAAFGQYCQRYINAHLAIITQDEVDSICRAIDISYQVATGKSIDLDQPVGNNPLERLFEIADNIMGMRQHRAFAYTLIILGAALLLGAIVAASILVHPAIALIASNITVALFKGLALVLGIVALTVGGVFGVAVGQAMFKQGNRKDFSLELNNFGVFCKQVDKARIKEQQSSPGHSARVAPNTDDDIFAIPMSSETMGLLGPGKKNN